MTINEKIENVIKKLKTRKSKNIIYIVLVCIGVGWFGHRFYAVFSEGNTDVFNIVRNDLKNGTPIETMRALKSDGVLYEPVTIQNNRAYVSGTRVGLFKAGQKIGDCKIISVSRNIDLDTGMHVIKTSNCGDGLKYVEIQKHGIYIPVSAVHGNIVYVVDNNIARAQNVKIGGRDIKNVLIDSGINNEDLIILSDVKDNQKIKIMK